jgi:membrane fusion protein, multidrug efflux system
LIDELEQPDVVPPDHRIGGHVPFRYRHKPLWILLWTLFLLAIGIVVFLLFGQHKQAEKKAAAAQSHSKSAGVAITTATAQKGNLPVYLDSIGTVTPVYTDSITSQVTGQIVAVYYKEGQIVQKGDPLVDIDPRPFRATLLQAQGALERDENVLAQAEMDLARYRVAWERNAIAKQQLDDQEKLVQQDKGTVKNDQGSVQFDQVQVDFCHITAPISGRVGLRLVDPGNVVQAAGTTTLAVITQLQPITVIFTVAEDSLGQVDSRLRRGAKLSVEAYDRTAQTKIATGQLITIDNQIDTTTGTVKGRAQFANTNMALFPNQFVNTKLLVNTLQGVTIVSSSAIQQNGNASFVYLIENNVALMRSVKAGISTAGNTQVEGINPGDVVADSGFDKLQDKAEIVVSNHPPASSSHGLGQSQSPSPGTPSPTQPGTQPPNPQSPAGVKPK